MGKLSVGRVLDSFCGSSGSSASCLCINNFGREHDHDDVESKPLMNDPVIRLKDVISGPPTLSFQLKPKTVVLRVSMHCNGCARKVEKHISKMEGVTSYQVELETKMVVVIGDIVTCEYWRVFPKSKMLSSGPPLHYYNVFFFFFSHPTSGTLLYPICAAKGPFLKKALPIKDFPLSILILQYVSICYGLNRKW